MNKKNCRTENSMKKLAALALIVAAIAILSRFGNAVAVNPTSNVLADSANTASTIVYRDTNGDFSAGKLTITTTVLTPLTTTQLAALTPVLGTSYLVYNVNLDGSATAGYGLTLTTATNGTGLGNYIWLSTRTTTNIGAKVQ
jgi:hypothetical protein